MPPHPRAVVVATAVAAPAEQAGAQSAALEDPRCNGTLRKQASPRPSEDSGAQRYSADPTVFLAERGPRVDTDEDGYMTPMKDRTPSGMIAPPQHLTAHANFLEKQTLLPSNSL